MQGREGDFAREEPLRRRLQRARRGHTGARVDVEQRLGGGDLDDRERAGALPGRIARGRAPPAWKRL